MKWTDLHEVNFGKAGVCFPGECVMAELNRQDAYALMCEYTSSDSLRRHMLAVEAAMRAYAQRLGEDVEKWGIVGLIHELCRITGWQDPSGSPAAGCRHPCRSRLSGRCDLRD